MKKIIYFLLLINLSISYGQEFEFAIIKDIDGFVNVRNTKNLNENNIVDKLENGFVVTHFGAEGNWILIDYEKNGKTQEGYVYKDRVFSVFNFTKLTKKKIRDNEIMLSTLLARASRS